MELLITPQYHNLFLGENDSLEDLLQDIPSIIVIQLIAMIDATLHVYQEDLVTQGKLFNLMLNRQPQMVKNNILKQAYKGEDQVRVRMFTRHYNMAFLHYELTHFRNLSIPDDDELEPEQEMRIFKAYFLVAEQWANPVDRLSGNKTEFNEDYFAKIMWPGMAAQFDLNYHIAPYHFMTRGAVLLNTLKYHTPHGAFVDAYLAKHHKATSLNYVMDVTQILSAVYASKKQSNREFPLFTLSEAPGFDTLYEQFSLDKTAYAETYAQQSQNYAGLKSKPLLKLDERTWIVLNWDFLANKLYEGLFFDFYEQSGIAEAPVFRQLTNFKSFVASEVTEKRLFRNLLKAALQSPHGKLLFDDSNQPNFPDAYYRIGNKLFLIELKDAAFPSAASGSFDYEQIVAAINKKINSKGKGTEQLLKQMDLLTQGPFEKEPGYKYIRNLQIYPVIIYTDTLFNMPGVNYYIAKSFRKKLTERGLPEKYRTIHPLTLINLNYLIGIFYQLWEKETSLDKVIEYYHHQISNREKKHEYQRTMENHIDIYDVFEYVVAPLFHKKAGSSLVKELFDALDLSEGLPARHDPNDVEVSDFEQQLRATV